MGVFDPSGEVDLGSTTPQVDTSTAQSINAIGNVINVAANAVTGKKTSSGSMSAKQLKDQALEYAFARDLSKIEVIRQKKGDAAAQMAEQKFIRNYVANGGQFSSANKEAVERITGRPFDVFGGEKDQEVVMRQQLLNSPSFTGAYTRAKHKAPAGSSKEQVTEYALNLMKTDSALEGELKTAQLSDEQAWQRGGQQTYHKVIDTFYDETLGGLTILGEEGGSVTNQDVRVALSRFTEMSANELRRPDNISDAQWKSIQSRINNTTKLLEGLVKNSSNDTIAADLAARMAQSVQAETPLDNLFKYQILKDPSKLLTNPNLQGEAANWVLKWGASKPKPTIQEEREVIINGDIPAQDRGTLTEGKTPAEVADVYPNAVQFISSGEFDLKDEETRLKVSKSYLDAFTAIEATEGFMGNKGISKVFNPKAIEHINKISKEDPEVGEAIKKKYLKTANDYGQRVQANVQAILNEHPYMKFDESGNLALNVEKVKEDYTPSQVQDIVEQFDRVSSSSSFSGSGFTFFEAGKTTDEFISGATIRTLQERNKSLGTLRKSIQGITNSLEPDVNTTGPKDMSSPSAPDAKTTTGLIAGFEGFRTNAYWDVNAWRTGFGSDTVTKADGSIIKVTKDTVVTREDALRDLNRRTAEFAKGAAKQAGPVWDSLGNNVQASLTSIAYNYGSLPSRIMSAVKSGDTEAIAIAVEGLAGDNDGVNRNRRLQEAAVIRGGTIADATTTTRGTPLATATLPSDTPEEPEGFVPTAPEPVQGDVLPDSPDTVSLPSEDTESFQVQNSKGETRVEPQEVTPTKITAIAVKELEKLQEGSSGLDEEDSKALKTFLDIIIRANPEGSEEDVKRAIDQYKQRLKAT